MSFLLAEKCTAKARPFQLYGVRVEDVEDPTMCEICCLEELGDELAKGKAMAKILRAG